MTKAHQSYFELSNGEKIDALEVGATKSGRPADLLEKDIWVVWALNALFDSPFGDSLAFKGGTSLSKVYHAIDRFSEDLDITYDIRKIIPEFIQDPEKPYPPNRSQEKKWTFAVRERLTNWVNHEIRPLIQKRLEDEKLGALLRVEGDTLHLDYEAVRTGTGYVRPAVLLEFGARSTGEPAEHFDVVCDIANEIAQVSFPQARPRVMNAERTFWEKATAIHAYCLREKFRGGDRYARHWYDLDCLDQIGIAQNALNDRVLASKVAEHKEVFFRENDKHGHVIDYAKAVTGHLCLVPRGRALEALQEDYRLMVDAGLFQTELVEFEILLERLAKLEHRANHADG